METSIADAGRLDWSLQRSVWDIDLHPRLLSYQIERQSDQDCLEKSLAPLPKSSEPVAVVGFVAVEFLARI